MDLTVVSAHYTICKPRMRKSCENSQPFLQTGHYSSTATVQVLGCFLRNVPRYEDAASSIWLHWVPVGRQPTAFLCSTFQICFHLYLIALVTKHVTDNITIFILIP